MPTARIIKRESPTALARELPYWTRSADVSVTNEYLHDAAALASPAFWGCIATCNNSATADMSLTIFWARRWCAFLVSTISFCSAWLFRRGAYTF